MTADGKHDFIVRVKADRLLPGTDYFYRIVFGRDKKMVEKGPVCRFKTLPGQSSESEVRFVMGSCMNYNKFMHGKEAKASGPVTASEEDKKLGFPSFQAIANLKPDFFIGPATLSITTTFLTVRLKRFPSYGSVGTSSSDFRD